jgi:hypothetical protein
VTARLPTSVRRSGSIAFMQIEHRRAHSISVRKPTRSSMLGGATRPYGGSDFFNSTVTSDVSAATSGAIVQAAIANNISMIARVNALTLAAR